MSAPDPVVADPFAVPAPVPAPVAAIGYDLVTVPPGMARSDPVDRVSGPMPRGRATSATAATPTTADLMAGFFARYAGSSLLTYRSKLSGFARWYGIAPADVPGALLSAGAAQTHLTVVAYRAWLRDDRRLAPATINGHLAALHAVVEFLREAGLCDWLLRVRYEKARGYRDTRGPGVPAIRRLLAVATATPDAVKAARDVAIVRLLIDLGLRRGELVALDVAHVEVGPAGTPAAVQVRGKGQSERQRLTLPPKTAAALAMWLAQHPGLRQPDASNADAGGGTGRHAHGATGGRTGERGVGLPLFTPLDRGAARPGRRATPRTITGRLTGLGVARLLATLGDRASIRSAVRPHGIRHTAITALLDAGLGLRDVQRFSRHADVRTLAVYDDNRTDIAGKMAVTMSDLV